MAMHEITGYPQMPAMSDDELDGFLAQPHVCRLSTINADGTAHTMPIWYEWSDGEILVSTQLRQRKVDNIRRDPRVTVLIDTATMPYRGVMMYGVATLDTENAASKRVSIFERYFGDHGAASDYARKMAAKWDPVVIRIRPTEIISFDYGKASFVPDD